MTTSADWSIKVEGLGKRYALGGRAGATSLREFVRDLPGRLRRRQPVDELWAVRDLDLEVRAGEAVGLIGRNGAGKSTLFKLLSRITHPTAGRIRLRGRVGSLLEVGTGFHPDLSGRDNVFLNGAILGMRRAEVARRFDEIVAFAEMERFIDLPVKQYSSGMFMRLAFAVAAHLETEILLVDEVLAVGDLGFQERCLGAMEGAAKGGRTILFVSHNLGAVRALTKRCLYLADGRLVLDAATDAVVSRYYDDVRQARRAGGSGLDWFRRDPRADSPLRIVGVEINGSEGDSPTVHMLQQVELAITVEVLEPVRSVGMTVIFKDAGGRTAAIVYSPDAGFSLTAAPGKQRIVLRLPELPLAPGRYHADIGLNQSAQSASYELLLDLPLFEVTNDRIALWPDRPWGVVHLTNLSWGVDPCA